VVDAGGKPWEIAADRVDLHLVERPGAGGRPEVEFLAPRVDLFLGQAGAEKQDLGQPLDVERSLPDDRERADGVKGSAAGGSKSRGSGMSGRVG